MSTTPTIYMIRHGEKPPADGIGLSAAGTWRAQHLPGIFGKDSDYNIGYILAEDYKADGKEDRPYWTVKPLADSLGLEIDRRFKRDKSEKVAEAVAAFQGPGNVLICWEHKALTDLATAIGVQDAPEYDGTRFDYLWTLVNNNTAIDVSTYSIPPDPAAATPETDGNSSKPARVSSRRT